MVPVRNVIIVACLWLVFVGGLWAYHSRKRAGLRVDGVDWLVCWAAIIYLGHLLLNMLCVGFSEGFQ